MVRFLARAQWEVCLAAIAALAFGPASFAATTADLNEISNGNCTLGEAILAANTGARVDACTLKGSGAPCSIQVHAN